MPLRKFAATPTASPISAFDGKGNENQDLCLAYKPASAGSTHHEQSDGGALVVRCDARAVFFVRLNFVSLFKMVRAAIPNQSLLTIELVRSIAPSPPCRV